MTLADTCAWIDRPRFPKELLLELDCAEYIASRARIHNDAHILVAHCGGVATAAHTLRMSTGTLYRALRMRYDVRNPTAAKIRRAAMQTPAGRRLARLRELATLQRDARERDQARPIMDSESDVVRLADWRAPHGR